MVFATLSVHVLLELNSDRNIAIFTSMVICVTNNDFASHEFYRLLKVSSQLWENWRSLKINQREWKSTVSFMLLYCSVFYVNTQPGTR